jgi:hypothetical protein
VPGDTLREGTLSDELMAHLPVSDLQRGTDTFLFGDIEGSTEQLKQLGNPPINSIEDKFSRIIKEI